MLVASILYEAMIHTYTFPFVHSISFHDLSNITPRYHIHDHYFAQGALVGGGIDASEPSLPVFLVLCVVSLAGFASLAAAPGNLVGGKSVPPVVVGLFVAITRPCGNPVPPPVVRLVAQGAAVPALGMKLVFGAGLEAQGAAVPTPGTMPSVDAGLDAHGAVVPSPGGCAVRADAFSRDSWVLFMPSRIGWLDVWTDVGDGLALGS